ncbi:MAG: hypothetical protein Q9174_007339 [Haloplaca sp. 1 TL-2023]
MSMISREPFQLSGRYADRNRWERLNGPGDARVTGLEVVKDEGLTGKWAGKVVIVTGVSSGMGVETVRAIASTGATVYGTARDIPKTKQAFGSLLDSGNVHLLHMDQSDLSSVRSAADEFRKQSKTLNVIVANAAMQ